MNNLIKELEKQATVKVRCGLNGVNTTEVFNRIKFAELIVRECGKSCTLQGDEDDMFCKFGIKHFGVEE